MMAEKLYLRPSALEEAVRSAMEHGEGFRYLAGGTDVLVNKFQGTETASCLIDLSGVEELSKISVTDDTLKIGSLVKLADLEKDAIIRTRFGALVQAAHAVASPVLRKTATLGGNLLCENRCVYYNQSEWWRESVGYCLKCNGDICIATGGKKNCFSKFVSDTAPVLISLDAQLEIVDRNGTSLIPLQDIYTGDGVHPRRMAPETLIRSVVLPLGRNYSCAFRKLRPRASVDFTSLTTAVSLCEGRIRIVLGGVDPRPVLIEGTTEDDPAKLILQAVKKPRVIDNDYYPRLYRKEMIAVFIRRSFEELKIPC